MNIMIVDDSAAMRMMVMKTLRQAGFVGHDISQASDGVDALEKIRQTPPDLILSDWNMPQMNGLELLNRLNEEGIDVTLGFVTTEATGEMRAKANDAGAKFLITKPFTAESFEITLCDFIN